WLGGALFIAVMQALFTGVGLLLAAGCDWRLIPAIITRALLAGAGELMLLSVLFLLAVVLHPVLAVLIALALRLGILLMVATLLQDGLAAAAQARAIADGTLLAGRGVVTALLLGFAALPDPHYADGLIAFGTVWPEGATLALVYALAWSAFCLCAAVILLQRRDMV
ncbi:MAG TPA: hypothetical protein PKM88_15785, partial [bacterium]|nr:hypothetical protein [bacterium]